MQTSKAISKMRARAANTDETIIRINSRVVNCCRLAGAFMIGVTIEGVVVVGTYVPLIVEFSEHA